MDGGVKQLLGRIGVGIADVNDGNLNGICDGVHVVLC